MSGGAFAGSSRVYRLDPHSLPVRSFAEAGGDSARVFVIERDRAVVRRASGETLTVALRDYRGVAVRMEPVGNTGAVRAWVELLHQDTSLTLPLAETDDPYDIYADWQGWAKTLNLPLLIVGQDGSVKGPLAGMGGVIAARTVPRRRHSFFAKRRPRFLTRRKTGSSEGLAHVAGREIIARD